jgi:hypothetical protein
LVNSKNRNGAKCMNRPHNFRASYIIPRRTFLVSEYLHDPMFLGASDEHSLFLPQRPDWLWDPNNPLINGYQGPFLGGKSASQQDAKHSSLRNAQA